MHTPHDLHLPSEPHLLQAHQPRQPLRPSKPWQDAQAQLGEAQPRSRGAKTRIACHGHLQATTQGDGLHRCHCGLGPRLQQLAEGLVDAAVDAAPAGLLQA